MGNGKERPLAGFNVLVVEDEALLRRRLGASLEALGAEVAGAENLTIARYQLSDSMYDFILLDVNLPDGIGLDLLREGEVPKETGVIVMTALGGVEGAVEAMRLGALDYLVKPFDHGMLPLVMGRARENRQKARVAEHERETEEKIGFYFGAAMEPLRSRVDKILEADARLVANLPPILITGETGTGKSTLARWIHNNGPRSTRPLIEVNCSALPDTLAESELFGNERGAFTDARSARQGLFEAAHGGTLFLDELPSLSPAAQAKILTALEDRKIRRLGGNREIEVDVRIIAATNRDLREAIEAREFREDLLHRLDLFTLNIPPLRERPADILPFAERLLERLCRQHRLPPREMTEEGRRRLTAHPWRGNVRELAHELERGLVFAEDSALDFSHLTGVTTGADAPSDWLNTGYDFSQGGFVMEDAINRLVSVALKQSGDNVSGAARMLGVTRDFIRYRLHGDRKAKV